MTVNKGKSAILVMKADSRTPTQRKEDILGIPIKTEYNYLEVTFKDSASTDVNVGK